MQVSQETQEQVQQNDDKESQQLGPEYDLDDLNEQTLVESRAIDEQTELVDQALPTKIYLEKQVLNQLYDALKVLARERPLNPIEFFSYYLLTKDSK